MTFLRKKGKVVVLFNILYTNSKLYIYLYAVPNFSTSKYLRRYSSRFFRAPHACPILGSDDSDMFTFLSRVLGNGI